MLSKLDGDFALKNDKQASAVMLSYFSSFFLLIFASIFFSGSTFAQSSLRFERISQEKGLSQTSINSILQDSRGFLWFATYEGLNRYDGYDFKVYRHEPDNPNSLSNSGIWSLVEDKEGNLWIGTIAGGLNKFNPKTEVFTHYFYEPNNPNSLTNNDVTSLVIDDLNQLWIGTHGGGLDRLDIENEKFTNFSHDSIKADSIGSDYVSSLLIDSSSKLWVGTIDGGLNQYEPSINGFKRFSSSKDDNLSNSVRGILEDQDRILIGTESGLFKLAFKDVNKEQGRYVPAEIDIGTRAIRSLYRDSVGTLWVGTDSFGLFEIANGSVSTVQHSYSPNRHESISSNIVFSIYEDSGNNLWFGTDGGGLSKLNRQKQLFSQHVNEENNDKSLSADLVSVIYQDSKGVIWIGTTGGGLNQYDPVSKSFKRIKLDNTHLNMIYEIFEDREGRIWLGSYTGGLTFLNRETFETESFTHDSSNPKSISHNYVTSIMQDNRGAIWVGTGGGGANLFDPDAKAFTRFTHNPKDPKSISSDYVWQVYQDRQKRLWFVTDNGGLDYFDSRTNSFSKITNEISSTQNIKRYHMMSILEDSIGNLWASSYGGGLYQVSADRRSIKQFTEKDGLANNAVYGGLEDRNGNLWFSTNKGISKLEPTSLKFVSFDRQNVFKADEFNGGAFHKSKNGTFYFGGKGLVEFSPELVVQNKFNPPIVLTDFFISNKRVKVSPESSRVNSSNEFFLPANIGYLDSLSLSYKHKIIAFEFASLSYHHPLKNKYRFKLEGLNDDWIETDSLHRRVTYTDLAPGDYTLMVQGSNDDGLWNEKGTQLRLTIVPPFWRTNWFIGVIIGFIVFMMWALHEYRTRLLKVRAGMLRQKVKERTIELSETNKELAKERDRADIANEHKSEFLAKMSHEIRTPLNGIIGMAEILVEENKGKEQSRFARIIQNSGNTLMLLINDILDFSKIESGNLQLENIDFNLKELISDLITVMSFQAIKKNIYLKDEVDSRLNMTFIGDPIRLKQILTNLVGNSIKFTDKGGIVVRAKLIEHSSKNIHISFEVEDTGIGIDTDNLNSLFDAYTQEKDSTFRQFGGTGLGLNISKQLVELMGGSIRATSQINLGTNFIFDIQLEESNNQSGVQNVDEIASDTLLKKEESNAQNALHKEDKPEKFSEILLVEDNEINRTVFSTMMKKIGHTVEIVENGALAVELLEKQYFPIVFMDMQMPVMDGLEATKRIREIYPQGTEQSPIIIAMTANASETDREKCLSAGMDDFMTKPINRKIIKSVLESWLEKTRVD